MAYYARIAKVNGRVLELWEYNDDQEQLDRPIEKGSSRGVYDLDITTHPQKKEINTNWFYNDDTDIFGDLPKDFVLLPEQPTTEERLADLQEKNQTLMLALAEQYEKQLATEENQQIIMLALAELYENAVAKE